MSSIDDLIAERAAVLIGEGREPLESLLESIEAGLWRAWPRDEQRYLYRELSAWVASTDAEGYDIAGIIDE